MLSGRSVIIVFGPDALVGRFSALGSFLESGPSWGCVHCGLGMDAILVQSCMLWELGIGERKVSQTGQHERNPPEAQVGTSNPKTTSSLSGPWMSFLLEGYTVDSKLMQPQRARTHPKAESIFP